jgi:hypothetical protein
MFGKPEWFGRRKYGGWGLTPKSWQGWAYVAILASPIVLIPVLPIADGLKPYLMFAWALLLCIDLIDIMMRLKKDEREAQIEAFAERNSAWAMVAAITFGVGYQAASGMSTGAMAVDPFLVLALFAGVAAKAATNLYLERKM